MHIQLVAAKKQLKELRFYVKVTIFLNKHEIISLQGRDINCFLTKTKCNVTHLLHTQAF